ncbi:hypothetical protein ACROYT_G015813 [Oculina patagonica]
MDRPRSLTSISLRNQQDDFVVQSVTGNVPPKRLRSVSLCEFNNKNITTKAFRRPSISAISFVNETGLKCKDNMAFVDDLELPAIREDAYSSSDNVKQDLVLQIGSATAAPNTSVNEDNPRPVADLKEEEENKQTGTVTWRLYWDYLKEGLPVPLVMFLAVALILAQVCLLAPNWWLARMAEMSHDQQQAPETQVIHACLVAVSIIVMAASSFFFYYLLLRAAENLHNKMTVSTIKAPVLFFDTNPAGRILNRFSKDVGCMDDSSRELKRIEAIKCSPVYSHITETANGLEIVHTSNMNKTFLDRLYSYQDENTQAFFMVLSCNRWLSLRLDLLSAVFITIVAVAGIVFTENPAFAGLALTYALQTLDVTQYGVRMASEVENLMTSVERVMTYTQIGSEPGYNTETRPPEPWPNEGSLAINDLSLVYFEGGPRILKDINLCVSSKEKVGVVGRTGAGKSSLVSALFRMPEPLGKVFIDGVDISSIDLQEARRSMAVITQDPVLFGGTLKRNMDPFSQYNDQDLWTALEEVQLKTLVEDLPGQLEFQLKESGANLSVGERQLVCLARALIQKNKIIIMDEATANVDFKTDRLIQDVIRDKFKDSTVLTIAHRLNTIMDYDKVLVLDGGRVVEFDKPQVLIGKGGLFAEMVKSQNQSVKH